MIREATVCDREDAFDDVKCHSVLSRGEFMCGKRVKIGRKVRYDKSSFVIIALNRPLALMIRLALVPYYNYGVAFVGM